MDYIIFNQDELLNITLIGFIGLCDNEYVIPECRNASFAAIGNVRAAVCMTAEECSERNVRFLNFTPEYIPKYANVPLVRDGAAKADDSFSSSYASSYLTSYSASYRTSTSFASSYMYEFEYEYQTSYRTSYRSSYSASYRSSYAASYSSSYTPSASYALTPCKNSREIIAVNGYGINLI